MPGVEKTEVVKTDPDPIGVPPAIVLNQLIVAEVAVVAAVNVVELFTHIVVEGVAVIVLATVKVPLDPAPPTVAPFGGKLAAMLLAFPDTIPFAPPVTAFAGNVPE